MTRTLSSLLVFLSLIVSVSASATMRERVKIVDGNVVADNGKPLRGAPFFLDIFGIQNAGGMRDEEQAFRQYFRTMSTEYNINAVRISPWIGRWVYMQPEDQFYQSHVDQFTYMADKVVQWAEEDGIYAIINLHTRFGTDADLTRMKAFWDVFAPRYKDDTHVVYELTNEPKTRLWVEGDQYYSAGADQSNTLIQDAMEPLYHYVRALAPDTHLILWSPNNPTSLPLEEIDDHSGTIDYSNASVGFHIYEFILDKKTEWNEALAYRNAGYPTILTEFYSLTRADNYPIDYAHLVTNLKTAEDNSFSWIHWSPTANYNNVNQNLSNSDLGFSQLYKDYVGQDMYAVFGSDGVDIRDPATGDTTIITDSQGRDSEGNPVGDASSEVRMVNDARTYWEADATADAPMTDSPTPTPDPSAPYIFSSFEPQEAQARGDGDGEIVAGSGFETDGQHSLRATADKQITFRKMVDYVLIASVANEFVSGKTLKLDLAYTGSPGDYNNVVVAVFDIGLNKWIGFPKRAVLANDGGIQTLAWPLDEANTSSDEAVKGKSMATIFAEATNGVKLEIFMDKASDTVGTYYLDQLRIENNMGASSPTPSPSPSPTSTPSPSPSSSATPTPLVTPTPMSSPTPEPSVTSNPRPSVAPTIEPTPSVTQTPTSTPAPSPTPIATATPVPSIAPSPTSVASTPISTETANGSSGGGSVPFALFTGLTMLACGRRRLLKN